MKLLTSLRMETRGLCAAAGLAVLLTHAPGAQAQGAADLVKQAEADFNANKLEEAFKKFQAAAAADPKLAAAHEGQGKVLVKFKRYKEAAAAYEKSATANNDFPKGWFFQGYALRMAEDWAGAVAAYQKYLEKAPNDQDGYFGLASAHEGASQRLPAADAYDKYAKLETRAAQKQWVEKAIAKAKALRAAGGGGGEAPRGEVAKALISEGKRHFGAKDFHLAAGAYLMATQMDANNAEAKAGLGFAYFELGQFQAATDALDAALRINANEPGVALALDRARTAAKEGDGEPGVKVEAAKGKAEDHFKKGQSALKDKDFGGALENFRRALAVRHDHSPSYVGRGNAYLAMGQAHRAALEYAKALLFDEAAIDALAGLGDANEKLGKAALAKKYYKRYLEAPSSARSPSATARAKKAVAGGDDE